MNGVSRRAIRRGLGTYAPVVFYYFFVLNFNGTPYFLQLVFDFLQRSSLRDAMYKITSNHVWRFISGTSLSDLE